MLNIKINSLIFVLILSSGCIFAQNPAAINNDNNTIDTLINCNKIRNNVVLITFGADAVTAINTKEGIVVIDAGISKGITQKIRKVIENKFRSDNFKYLINTHYHPDHYGGNSIFEETEIIGHSNGKNEITEQWKDTARVINRLSSIVNEYESELKVSELGTVDWTESFTQKMRYSNALMDAQRHSKILQPTRTFKDSLQINTGEIKIEMIYFGKCHSNSDILIFIPEIKILFTGDLVFKYGRPGFNNSQPEEKELWSRAVNWIEKRIPDIETIISGHGVILSVEDIKSFNKIILEE